MRRISLIRRGALAALLLAVLALPAMLLPARAQQTAHAATAVVATVAPTLTPTKTATELIGANEPVATGGELLARYGILGALGLLILGAAFAIVYNAAKKTGEGIGEYIYKAIVGRRLEQRLKQFDERDQNAENTKAQQRALDSGLAAYLDWLQSELQYLPQIPLDQQQHDLTLREVYVPLRVVERAQIDRFTAYMLGEFGAAGEYHTRREAFGELERSQRVYRLLSDQECLPPRPAPDRQEQRRAAPEPAAEESERTTTRLLLVGDAGSGKTTTLHYGALMLAEDCRRSNSLLARSELDLHCHDRPLPVYIRLTLALTYLREKYRADRSRLTNNAAELLLEWLDFDLPRQVVASDFPPHFISAQLKAGGCLVLLDGLDETGDAEERGYVKQLINNLVQACPKNRYIVASRPFDGVGQGLTGFLERRLSPLDADEIQRLLRQWFNAAQRTDGAARRRRRSAEQEYADLWGKLEATPRLFDMATNPLLLTSMAVLVHGGDPLPPERAKIYNRLISLTLVRWREAQIRAGQPPESAQSVRLYAEESDDDVRRRLQQLAAWMLQHQRREILLREAQDLLAPVYATNRQWLPERSRNHVQALMRLLALHSGVIQERDQGYSFIHFTLQEYLTARDYDERDDIQGLVDKWPEARWRETILLAVGHWATSGYPQRAQMLLEALLRTGDVEALFLAAEALDEANARLVTSLLGVLNDAAARLRTVAFDPVDYPDPRTRNEAAGWLDRLDADRRPGLDLLRSEYWAEPIAPGPFLMGEGAEAFTYHIRHPYALARFPVTNRQYLTFLEDLEGAGNVEEAHRRRPRGWPGSRYRAGEGNHPVVDVSWENATEFAAWVDRYLHEHGVLADGERVRLPTEPEWERAAAYPLTIPSGDSGAGRRKYPWGEWQASESVIPANTQESAIRGTSVVGIFPQGAAACGAKDLAGNVWERCSTPSQNYPLPEELAPETLDTYDRGRIYVLRGGSWRSGRSYARCAYRFSGGPSYFSGNLGFRLARLFSSGSS